MFGSFVDFLSKIGLEGFSISFSKTFPHLVCGVRKYLLLSEQINLTGTFYVIKLWAVVCKCNLEEDS